MLDRHAVQALVRANVTAREIAEQLKVSVRTVRRIVREGEVATGDDVAAQSARQVGRPQVTEAVRARVHALVLEDPERPPGEICRLLKEDGTPLGLSTVYCVLTAVRATIPTALQVRFEGVAGEFAQCDFGHVSVRLTLIVNPTRERQPLLDAAFARASIPASAPAFSRPRPDSLVSLSPDVTAALTDVSLDAPWPLIERFTTLRREHPTDVATAADEIVARLRAHGVPVEVHRPTLFLSLPGKASVTVKDATLRAKPMAMSVPYPDGLTAPLVYVPARYARNADEMFTKGFVSDADIDVAGKIVVSEGFGMPGKVAYFEQRGALGMIAVNPGANPHWGICTTVWGTPDLRDLPRKPKIAVVAVNNPDGQILIAHAATGGDITLRAEVTDGWFESPIPVVTIPGTDEPESFVLLHGHYDSWDFGIGDNAVGDACMLEVARVLWKHRDRLKRTVRIAWWPGHSTGRYAGSTWFADHFAIDLYENCIAQVNCDSPGCRWATEYIDVSLMDETEEYCAGVINAVAGKELKGERPHQAGDYSFNNIGISSFFMLLSTMPTEHRERLGYYAVGGCGANIAWHTEEDLIHIADRDILLTDIKIYLASVMGVANATVAPFDFRKTVRTLGKTLEGYAAPVQGLVDFSPARVALEQLDAALEQFDVHARSVATLAVGDAVTRRTNRALRRLARLLVQVNYTRGPAFFHDPAETTPALPDLAAALQAPEMSQWDRGFLATHLVRGQNRLVAALRDGRRALEQAMEPGR